MRTETHRRRRLASIAARAGLAALAVVLLAAPARTAPAPDSSALVRIQAASAGWNRFNIVTTNSAFMLASLRLDEEGVVVSEPQRRPAVFVTANTAPGETKRAPWRDIERIEGMRSHSLRIAVAGAILGGLIGYGLGHAARGGLHDAADVAVLASPAGAAVGGIVGALLGGATGWHPLYP